MFIGGAVNSGHAAVQITIPSEEYKFVNPVTICRMPHPPVHICQKLVATEYTIEELLYYTNSFIYATGGEGQTGEFRVPPCVVDQIARGGKTTILRMLFNRFKEFGYCPIYISFNGNFKLRTDETHLEAILRTICCQFCDMASIPAEAKIYIDQKQLLDHISSTRENRPVILLVDELNTLAKGDQLEEAAALFLKCHFLDAFGYYFIFSTHIPMSIDQQEVCKVTVPTVSANSNNSESEMKNRYGLLSQFIYSISNRRCIYITMPLSTNIEELRLMAEDLNSITGCQVALYGGIPSLIYCVLHEPKEVSIRHRYDIANIRTKLAAVEQPKQVLAAFVSALIDGIISPEISLFKSFGYVRYDYVKDRDFIYWPLCYIECIFSDFKLKEMELPNKMVKHLSEKLKTFSGMAKSGLDWEIIVQFSLLFHCLNSQLNDTKGPFEIVWNAPPKAVSLVNMPSECQTLDAFHRWWINYLKTASFVLPCVVLMESTFVSFPHVDGFIIDITDRTKYTIYVYQCKLKTGYPTKNLPSWIKKGYLIQGDAANKCIGSKRLNTWNYLNKDEILELLGVSLSPLYPSDWVTTDADITTNSRKRSRTSLLALENILLDISGTLIIDCDLSYDNCRINCRW